MTSSRRGALLLVVVVAWALVALAAGAAARKEVMWLDASNFDTVTQDPEKAAMVIWTVGWCPNCHYAVPMYESASDQLQKRGVTDVVLAGVDITGGNEEVGDKHDISSFPTYHWYRKSPLGSEAVKKKPVPYRGKREEEHILAFIDQEMFAAPPGMQ